ELVPGCVVVARVEIAKPEFLHPAIACFEHRDEMVFELLPVVVAPEKKGSDGRAELGGAVRGICGVELQEGSAGCAAIKLFGLIGDFKAGSQGGKQRLAQGDF